MDAILLAGGIPQPDEPLYKYSAGKAKALIDVAGKPMVQWVVDALNEAPSIERIVLIGLSAKSELPSRKPITYLSNEGKLLENIKAGTAKVMELNPKAKYVLLVSSDIPAVTADMVEWLVKTCAETKDDLYYNVVPREVMENVFPGSKRTYTPLKGMDVCGGDMNMVRAAIVNENSAFWNRIIEARKSPARLAAALGPSILFKLLLRQLTPGDVIQQVASKLGLQGRAIVCPHAEIGMDVDKPHQLEMMRSFLEARSKPRKAARTPAAKPARRTAPAKKTAGTRQGRPRKKTTNRTKS